MGAFAKVRDGHAVPAAPPVAIPDDLGRHPVQVEGRVFLSHRVQWSNLRSYDLSSRDDRRLVYELVMTEGAEDDVRQFIDRLVYELVMTEGAEEDVRQFIDVDVLTDLWCDLVLPRHVRARAQRELAESTSRAAAMVPELRYSTGSSSGLRQCRSVGTPLVE